MPFNGVVHSEIRDGLHHFSEYPGSEVKWNGMKWRERDRERESAPVLDGGCLVEVEVEVCRHVH